MRHALLSNARQESAGDERQYFLPSPLKGWSTTQNARKGDPGYASTFVNYWATANDVELRKGSAYFANRTAAGLVRSLYSFKANVIANDKLFAVTDNGVYDVTAGGAYGVTVQALTSGLWQAVNITNSAGTNFLWGVNGVDTAKHWNGAAWATPTITGVTSSNLNYCWLFKRRIFAIEKDSFNAWFLPVDSIAGVASKFPVGGLFSRGGYLLSGATWTLDGGNGPDDYCIFISSEGEVAVYQGVDPTSAASWGLVGVFFIGRPRSARCWCRVGADLFIATDFGLVSLSKVVQGHEVTPQNVMSKQIWTQWQFDFQTATAGTAWQVVPFVYQNMVLLNINLKLITNYQYAMNLSTGAWSLFLNWDAECFCIHGNKLYAGWDNGYVIEVLVGSTEYSTFASTADIQASCSQVPIQLLAGKNFHVEVLRAQINFANATTFTLNGTTLPSGKETYWCSSNFAANNYFGVQLSVDGGLGGKKWYGTDIRYRVMPAM